MDGLGALMNSELAKTACESEMARNVTEQGGVVLWFDTGQMLGTHESCSLAFPCCSRAEERKI